MAKNFSYNMNTYFPTLVFNITLKKHKEMNQKLLEAIYEDRDNDPKGQTKSNVEELGGWHSKTNLHQQKTYNPLTKNIREACKTISSDLGYHDDYALKIGSMWSIINPPGGMNIAHVHPGCIWSGVYYVQTPEDCGNIEFIEPRTVHLMNQPRFKDKQQRRRECWTKVNFTPKAGKMIIFPAWLYHSVRPNASKETGRDGDRVIISFNINQKKVD